MRTYKTAALASRIKKGSDELLMHELEKNGIKGVVPSHGGILYALYHSPKPMTMKDIADAIDRTQPTVTVLTAKIEELGYVKKTKSGDDARVTYITLTEKGREIQGIFDSVTVTLNKTLHKGFSDNDAETLEFLLKRAADNF